ncbi:MAG: hypothetical protein E7Z93_06595 [Cyanobacteria bacterium SIG32]|nr:hypothetical protein [Cyanobacteria bacterium SIG32]
MFGYMPITYSGYSPKVSDTMSAIQMGLAGFRGVVSGLEAKNDGASTAGAIAYGLSNTAFDVGGALLGNAIDKGTRSYMGTTMNSIMTSGMGAPLGMTMFASSMMSPYSMMGYSPFMMGNPMLMGGSMMYGMPRFGGFCCHC